jgi:hypothetical protein
MTLELLKDIADLQQAIPALAVQSGLTESLAGIATVTSSEQSGRKVLTLSISDSQLKSMIANGYMGLRNNDALMQVISGLFWSMMEADYSAQDLDMAGITPDIITQAFDVLAVPLYTEIFSVVPLFGDEGITYQIVLDERGVIQNDSIIFDYRIDVGALSLFDPTVPLDGGVIDMKVTMNNFYSRINAPGTLSLPLLSDENCLDMTSLMGIENTTQIIDKYNY